jgi:pimeloyl-ACP methyl ester carboxylesterase
VLETGSAQGPAILFIHGYSQSYLSWEKQLHDPELKRRFHLIAFDLRGHGASGKPSEPDSYSAQAWADDLEAVIVATGARRPMLVAWSMGGTVVFDYLLAHGGKSISGIDLVASAATLGHTPAPPDPADPDTAAIMRPFLEMQSNDILANLAGTRAFVGMLTAKPLPPADTETIVIYNMLTPAYARVAMFQRLRAGYLGLRGKIEVPVLLTHGDRDAVVPYAGSVGTLPHLPHGRLSTYRGVGHAPFLEEPTRFNTELAAFVEEVTPH